MHTPSYIIDLKQLEDNLKILKTLKDQTGCKILLAQKAFSIYQVYPLISKYLDGTCSSGVNELLLSNKYFLGQDKEHHAYAAAFRDDEIDDILNGANHIVFNSIYQFNKFKDKAKAKGVDIGIRINPEISTQETHAIYDPCAKLSRLGTRLIDLPKIKPEEISGLHFHTLCEQNSDALKKTLEVVDKNFSHYLQHCKWINFGGGHHITKQGYDIDTLKECIKYFREKYNLTVYLEPGEAVALNAGTLITTVLDKMDNYGEILVVDSSAACHAPDVIEMPYTPHILGEGKSESKYKYRISGPSCLSGDSFGDYAFDQEIKIGDKIEFLDMAIYSMVKNNTFNGINLPSIYTKDKDGKLELIKEFGYKDFEDRL